MKKKDDKFYGKIKFKLEVMNWYERTMKKKHMFSLSVSIYGSVIMSTWLWSDLCDLFCYIVSVTLTFLLLTVRHASVLRKRDSTDSFMTMCYM